MSCAERRASHDANELVSSWTRNTRGLSFNCHRPGALDSIFLSYISSAMDLLTLGMKKAPESINNMCLVASFYRCHGLCSQEFSLEDKVSPWHVLEKLVLQVRQWTAGKVPSACTTGSQGLRLCAKISSFTETKASRVLPWERKGKKCSCGGRQACWYHGSEAEVCP